ncbi:MAG: hypothetical protein IJ764_03385 [Bacteroidales bacterium]|nr:hypothetical protein [Bacteroidales bacterium]
MTSSIVNSKAGGQFYARRPCHKTVRRPAMRSSASIDHAMLDGLSAVIFFSKHNIFERHIMLMPNKTPSSFHGK